MIFDTIHNYYERLVIEHVMSSVDTAHADDANYLADVACLALNALPPRYIRHDVDMAYFLSNDDRTEMAQQVRRAVEAAIQQIDRQGARAAS